MDCGRKECLFVDHGSTKHSDNPEDQCVCFNNSIPLGQKMEIVNWYVKMNRYRECCERVVRVLRTMNRASPRHRFLTKKLIADLEMSLRIDKNGN
jgi:hypothetical protein